MYACNTGDVHSGQRKEIVNSSWPFYFAGHLTITALIDHLKNTSGLATASKVLLSGSSAGGLACFVNADYYASQLPGADVRGHPIAGFFFPSVVPYVEWEAKSYGPPYVDGGSDGVLWNSFVNQVMGTSGNEKVTAPKHHTSAGVRQRSSDECVNLLQRHVFLSLH
jgi:hypothetical protein